MKTRWTGLIYGFGKRSIFHPSKGVLQAYHDGALNTSRAGMVSRHLQDCSECRQAETRQADALQWFAAQDQLIQEKESQVPRASWEQLETSLNAYVSNRSIPLRAGIPISSMDGALKELVIGELQMYLGNKLVSDLLSQLRRSGDGCPDLIQKAEPYLTAFLGEKASKQIQFEISMAFANA